VPHNLGRILPGPAKAGGREFAREEPSRYVFDKKESFLHIFILTEDSSYADTNAQQDDNPRRSD
jgi:hypothetical protein